jgi:hypothetical protein
MTGCPPIRTTGAAPCDGHVQGEIRDYREMLEEGAEGQRQRAIRTRKAQLSPAGEGEYLGDGDHGLRS